MLFYDIVITFGDEVERIWKQRFTGATVLWFLVSLPRTRLLMRPAHSARRAIPPALEPLPFASRLHSHYRLYVILNHWAKPQGSDLY